ncbi:hypothetical protein [Streptacidiphilus rugosus]|uniref:hypothetical protein n=1 Tax=Streptacidiphilus rugosus TaxID=405783 RepID=UPI0005608B01|nr:hypothetical protein [Streptacidiphilus rugosus]
MSTTRIKAVAAVATVAAAVAGVALSGIASAAPTPHHAPAAAHDAAVRNTARSTAVQSAADSAATSGAERVRLGEGRVGGVAWSVALEYYRTLPKGYTVPTFPPGVKTPTFTGLLCERMYLGGVRIDHQGGPWADCSPVTGPRQALGDEGLFGFTAKGTSGTRLFVAENSDSTAYAVVTFTNGRTYRASSAHVPGTGFSGYAVPIGKGQYIRSVDTFDAHGHRLTHQTDWH